MAEKSMVPTFAPGEHVLTFRRIDYRVGDVVVFCRDGKNYIKRVARVSSGLYNVVGDNARDSVSMPPVSRGEILGKVIFRY